MALNALFTGSAGLRANSSALDVIGNNLANTSTTGFKGQRVQFSDLVYQTLNAGSGPTATNGGVNPSQLGFGVGIATIGTNLGQGNLNSTGRALDVGIQGQGFFVLNNGSRNVYSRNGAFDVDANGFLVDPNSGLRVQRFGNIGEGNATTPPFQVPGDLNIRIPFGAGVPGNPTTSVNFQGNINSASAVGDSYSTAIQIFDTQSTSRALNVTFTKTANNTYNLTSTINGGTVALTPSTITFDSSGLIQAPSNLAATITLTGFPTPMNVNLNLGTPGFASGVTQFGSPSSAAATTQDGRGSGVLNSISFDTNGTVQGIFSNGRTIALAQLGIASFNNPSGLLREGTNYFSTSSASGEASIGVAGSGGRGAVQGGTLEGSNVDIAVEFSRLIIAQRGFQVNARTITASNEVLQELANIIR